MQRCSCVQRSLRWTYLWGREPVSAAYVNWITGELGTFQDPLKNVHAAQKQRNKKQFLLHSAHMLVSASLDLLAPLCDASYSSTCSSCEARESDMTAHLSPSNYSSYKRSWREIPAAVDFRPWIWFYSTFLLQVTSLLRERPLTSQWKWSIIIFKS